MQRINKILGELRARPLLLDTITTTVWSSLGKAAGFLVPFFIAAWFGVTEQTDAFFFAYGIILFLTMIFSPVVEGVIVPFIVEGRDRNEDVGKFIGGILVVSAEILLGISLLMFLSLKPVLLVITKFDKKGVELIYYLLLETTPLMILIVWTSILTGALNAYKRFFFPAIAPAIRAGVNLIVILILKDVLGVHAIAVGYIIGELVRFSVLIYQIRLQRLFKIKIVFSISAQLKSFFKVASFQTLGMIALGLNPFIGKIMASWLDKGSVSVLEYAGRLFAIPEAFMSAGIMTTTLSHWSNDQHGVRSSQLGRRVRKAAYMVGIVSLVVTLILIIMNRPLVNLAYGRGNFPREKLHQVSNVWICYLLGFIPYMIGRIYVRAHLTLKNTRIVMKYGIYSVILTFILNMVLMRYFGLEGIALASSVIFFFYMFYTEKALKEVIGK